MTTSSYTMPAEWDKHEATLLAWPHNKNDWPDRFAPIPWVYADIIRLLSLHERVWLLMRSEKDHKTALEMLERIGADLDKIDFFHVPTDRIWMRDSGPICVRKVESEAWRVEKDKLLPPPATRHSPPVFLDFRFNAWAKYPNHKKDDVIPSILAEALAIPTVQPMHKGKRVVLEGGSIDVNGAGTLLTTEECLLSDIQCRNPGFKRGDYEQVFAKYLGINDIVWFEHGIVGDDTHGHVDDLARFVNKDTIALVVENNKKDDNYALLQANLKRLKKTKFNIIELPMPKAILFEGERLPASYANFYIANKQVLVPTFNDPNDRLALNLLAEAFPKHEIVGVHCLDFVWGLGTLHCMSQQIPL